MTTAEEAPSSSVKRLLTALEVAGMLQVTPNTFRRWAREKKIAHVRSGTNRMRFRPEDIEAFIEQRRVAAVEED